MLILCTGTDSFRSRLKARELEAAYRAKYDPAGSSIESLTFGSAGVDALSSLMATGSLFSKRRFIRFDNVVGTCPKGKRHMLLNLLSRNVEDTIIVSVEDKEMKSADLKEYKALPKFFCYDFPSLSPAPFLAWCRSYASENGLNDTLLVESLSAKSQGDTWQFVNEFWKCKAGGSPSFASGKDVSVYDVIESFLYQSASRWTEFSALDDASSVLSLGVAQSRSLTLIQAGHREGIHPFVVQKLSRLQHIDSCDRYMMFSQALIRSRNGFTSDKEAMEMI